MKTISDTEDCEGEDQVQKDVNKMRKENNQDEEYSEKRSERK